MENTRWIYKKIIDRERDPVGFFSDRWFCPECNQYQTYGRTPFCPNCGADLQINDTASDRVLTHGDIVRGASDEKLAEWFSEMDDCPSTAYERRCNNNCYKCWLDWLQSEVCDETDNSRAS